MVEAMDLKDRFDSGQISDLRDFCLMNAFVDIDSRLLYDDDGELQIYLNDRNLYLDIGFPGDGTYGFYAKVGDEEFVGDDKVIITSPLPQPLRNTVSITLTKRQVEKEND